MGFNRSMIAATPATPRPILSPTARATPLLVPIPCPDGYTMIELARQAMRSLKPDSRPPTSPIFPPRKHWLRSLLHSETSGGKDKDGRDRDLRVTRAWTIFPVSRGKRCNSLHVSSRRESYNFLPAAGRGQAYAPLLQGLA
jgi:hypothetical protein